MKENVSYKMEKQSEVDGLVFNAINSVRSYKFLIIRSLLLNEGLDRWVNEKDYYKAFIEKRIDSLIKGAEEGFYNPRENGYIVIDRFANL